MAGYGTSGEGIRGRGVNGGRGERRAGEGDSKVVG